LFPLKGTLSQREAPDTIYLITGSADVMLGQAEAIGSNTIKGNKIIQTTKTKILQNDKTKTTEIPQNTQPPHRSRP
jgi:hypothetical protein